MSIEIENSVEENKEETELLEEIKTLNTPEMLLNCLKLLMVLSASVQVLERNVNTLVENYSVLNAVFKLSPEKLKEIILESLSNEALEDAK